MTHKWEMDVSRTRMDISIYVWKCKYCGCLQIRNGSLDGKSIYRPNDPTWSPFKTLTEEPPCVLLRENHGTVKQGMAEHGHQKTGARMN